MTQPDDFGFGEEAALLKESARKLLAQQLPVAKLHAMVAADPTPERVPQAQWDAELWRRMVDLGWTGIIVPEAAGGAGMPLVAAVGLVEEVGRAAVPCPLLTTLNATCVLSGCGADASAALTEIVGGAAATLALTGSAGEWDVDGTEVECRDGRLHGTAWFVQEARKVDRLLVAARQGADIALYWVDARDPGVSILPDAIVDLTRDQAHVAFDGVAGACLCADARGALSRAMPAIWTALAADIAGAAEWQLQTTVEYVGTRKQFDRPLGFFQAVKHPLVNVMVQIDETRSLVYNAACAFDTEPEWAARYAHMAKASSSDTAALASGSSIQCHGGIGFTWECYLHLYFKRQKHSQVLWGDAGWHRRRLADLLLGAVA